MSGGRFYYVSGGYDEVICQHRSAFREMTEALEKHAPGHPSALAARQICDGFDRMRAAEEDHHLLRVWHALEWWYSGDWGEDDFREALAAYDKAKARTEDPRLAGLPESLRAVASEFLTLHGAWETEFRIESPYRGNVSMLWKSDPFESAQYRGYVARFEWSEDFGWEAYAREFVAADERASHTSSREDSVRWTNSRQAIRHLPEFAAFVQRFKRTEAAE